MPQILSHLIESTSPSQKTFNYTVDNSFSTFTKPVEVDLISEDRSIVKKTPLRIKGFNKQFKPKLHCTVPELLKLTDKDLEDLIGERNRNDFDDV
jgi:hypothetical protein